MKNSDRHWKASPSVQASALLLIMMAGSAQAESAYPVSWGRQLGTAGSDQCHGVSADALGNVYICGFTTGALGGANLGSLDAFVSKYDAQGACCGRDNWDLRKKTKLKAFRPMAWGMFTSRALPPAR